MEQIREDLRGKGDEEATIATVDEDLRQREDGTLDVNGQRFVRAERRRAADLVAHMPMRDFGLARRHGLCADLAMSGRAS